MTFNKDDKATESETATVEVYHGTEKLAYATTHNTDSGWHFVLGKKSSIGDDVTLNGSGEKGTITITEPSNYKVYDNNDIFVKVYLNNDDKIT